MIIISKKTQWSLMPVLLLASIMQVISAHAAIHLNLIDNSRNRIIPIALYEPQIIKNCPIAIISHGHDIKYTEYSFIAEKLAVQGYFTASIQHDLANDPPLPNKKDIFERRKPLWERGTQNISFVIEELRKIIPCFNSNTVMLIGHSGGGDISMMFAEKYPQLVSQIISLDSLRYPFPTKNHLPILALRANDTRADNGILSKTGAVFEKPLDVKHIDMCDRGAFAAKQEIIAQIMQFIKAKK